MMSVKRVEFTNKKSGLRYDAEKRVYIGYKIDVWVGGKRHRENGFATHKQAETFIDRLRSAHRDKRKGLTSPKTNTVTVAQLFERRLSQLTKKFEASRTRTVFEYFINEVLEGDMPIYDVRRAHFQTFTNARLADGIQPVSIRRELARLSTAFKKAPELFPKELEEFEAPTIPRPKIDRRKKNRRIITLSEMEVIKAHLAERRHIKESRMFALAWYLGLRYTEVLKLEKLKYHRASRTLEAERFKTDDLTNFEYLPDEVIEIIDAAIKDSNDPVFIFPHTTIYPNSFYEMMREAIEAAGLEYGRSKPSQVSFHSTRHSFTTRLMEVADLGTTQSFTAHSDATMAALYSHSTPQKRKAAMERLYGTGLEAKEIFDKTRAGKMDFESFREAILRLHK